MTVRSVMRSLSRALHDGMESSMPLPYPFKKWEKAEAQFYRGAVSVLAGPPGSGKTISALNIVDQLRVPTLYFSNDSTRYTIIKRAFSMLSGYDARKAAEIIEKNPEQAYGPLNQLWMVRWDFSSSPDMEEIAMYGDAFREVYGEYPHLTIIDIAMNVNHEGVAEQNYWRFFPAIKELASAQNTAALVVHHTSENAKYDYCPPKSSVMGKANQLPELIVTQVLKENKMLYSVVKNRNGSSDESGDTHWTMPVDASKCKIEDEDPDEGILFRDGPSVPASMKIDNTKGEW